jgi:hypothetical protein
MQFSPFDTAPVSVELSIPSISVSPSYSPIIRGTGDTRHLSVIASFARECCPSEMVAAIDGYCITFQGHDRYRMAIYLFRYVVAHGMARTVWSGDSCRPFRGRLVMRSGAEIAASIGKTYVFIGWQV